MTTTVHVDWYSFTTKLKSRIEPNEYMVETARNSIEYVLGRGLFEEIFVNTDGWTLGGGRKAYKGGYINPKYGISVWFGGQSNVLIEFTGKGCAFLAKNGWLRTVVDMTHDRTTRMDIAIDVDGENRVMEIKNSLGNKRIRSFGQKVTPNGHTEYIGNRTSDKFCRVYAYLNPEHPRYGKTRVEYEFHGKQAKIMAFGYLQDGVVTTAQQINNYYKWGVSDLTLDSHVKEVIPSVTSDRSQGKKIEWLKKQVRPAIQNLIDDMGITDPKAFVLEMLLPEYIEKEMQDNG